MNYRPNDLLKRSFRTLVIVFAVCVWPSVAFGQVRCLNPEDVQKLVAQVNVPQSATLNKTLSNELLALKKSDQKQVRADVANNRKADDLFQGLKETRNKNASALCQMLETYGWPSAELVGAGGGEATLLLIKHKSFELQLGRFAVEIAGINQRALDTAEVPR